MPTTTTAEAAAQATLQATWLIPGSAIRLPVDPISIARALDIDVYLADLGPDNSGQIQKRAGGRTQIFLSRLDHPNRQRFTCAHEVGHFVRRRPDLDTTFEFVDRRDWRSAMGTEVEEVWANQFAAELLMPESDIRSHWDAGVRSLYTLAERFGVSKQSMDLRLRNLRITP